MMQISLKAPSSIQASHYSLLATFEVLGKLIFQPFISIFTDFFGYSLAFILFIFLYLLSILLTKWFNKNVSQKIKI
jgi:hypothetical protein